MFWGLFYTIDRVGYFFPWLLWMMNVEFEMGCFDEKGFLCNVYRSYLFS